MPTTENESLTMSCQHSDIINETADEFLVVAWLAGLGEKALPPDVGRGDFDFEFVFFVGFGGGLVEC